MEGRPVIEEGLISKNRKRRVAPYLAAVAVAFGAGALLEQQLNQSQPDGARPQPKIFSVTDPEHPEVTLFVNSETGGLAGWVSPTGGGNESSSTKDVTISGSGPNNTYSSGNTTITVQRFFICGGGAPARLGFDSLLCRPRHSKPAVHTEN